MSNVDLEAEIEAGSLETATSVVNCLFQGLMPEWAVDCGVNAKDVLGEVALQVNPSHTTSSYAENRGLEESVSTNGEIAITTNGEIATTGATFASSREMQFAECVKTKFGPWQFSVLTAFQGYLARMPLQQHQLLVMQYLRLNIANMQTTVDDSNQILLDTIHLQRATVESLSKTSEQFATLIEQRVLPFLDILPDVAAVEQAVSALETQIDHARTWWRRLISALIPSLAVVLALFNWKFHIPLAYSIPVNAFVCVAYHLGFVPTICALKTIWAVFLVLRLMHCAFPPVVSEEDDLYDNIYRLLQKRSKRQHSAYF